MSKTKRYGSHAEKLLLISPDLFETMLAKIQTPAVERGPAENQHRPDLDISSTVADNAVTRMNTALEVNTVKTPANRVTEYASALNAYKNTLPSELQEHRSFSETTRPDVSRSSPIDETHSEAVETEIPNTSATSMTSVSDATDHSATPVTDKLSEATRPVHSPVSLHTKHNLHAGLTEKQNKLVQTIIKTIDTNKERIRVDDEGDVYIDSQPLNGNIKEFVDGIVSDKKTGISQSEQALEFTRQLLKLGLPKSVIKNKHLSELIKYHNYIHEGWSES